MTPEQRAAAERLIAEHPTLFMNDLPDWCDDAFHLLRELAEVPVQEPIGWLHDETGDFEPSHKPWMDDDEEWVPLYAAPQQPMRCPTDGGECGAGGYCRPEQRKPLLASDIVTMYAECPTCDADMIDFARAIERAHGITGEPT